MNEMLRAIRESNNGKAAGRDDIPYEMVKNLGPLAQQMLLDSYQRCWRGKGIPSAWRTAVIKTLLKEDKDPKYPTSYCPISLTSCLGKILEKIITNRLIYVLEERGLLTNNQAGFRPGRSTVDQLLKLVQDASDNMHSKPKGKEQWLHSSTTTRKLCHQQNACQFKKVHLQELPIGPTVTGGKTIPPFAHSNAYLFTNSGHTNTSQNRSQQMLWMPKKLRQQSSSASM